MIDIINDVVFLKKSKKKPKSKTWAFLFILDKIINLSLLFCHSLLHLTLELPLI